MVSVDTKVLVGATSDNRYNPTHLFPVGRLSSLASRPSHYAGSQQEIRHEIECFFATSYDSLRDTSIVVGKDDTALLPNSSRGKCEARQTNLERQEISIIFITAHENENIRSRLLEQGAVECLFKPFSETALLEALNAALQMS